MYLEEAPRTPDGIVDVLPRVDREPFAEELAIHESMAASLRALLAEHQQPGTTVFEILPIEKIIRKDGQVIEHMMIFQPDKLASDEDQHVAGFHGHKRHDSDIPPEIHTQMVESNNEIIAELPLRTDTYSYHMKLVDGEWVNQMRFRNPDGVKTIRTPAHHRATQLAIDYYDRIELHFLHAPGGLNSGKPMEHVRVDRIPVKKMREGMLTPKAS